MHDNLRGNVMINNTKIDTYIEGVIKNYIDKLPGPGSGGSGSGGPGSGGPGSGGPGSGGGSGGGSDGSAQGDGGQEAQARVEVLQCMRDEIAMLSNKLKDLSSKVTRLDGLASLTEVIEGHTGTFEEHVARLDDMQKCMSGMDKKLEDGSDSASKSCAALAEAVATLRTEVEGVKKSVDLLREELTEEEGTEED